MRKILLASLVLLYMSGCKNRVEIKDNSNVEILDSKGMDGKPEYLEFLNTDTAYSFNTLQRWPEQTISQIDDPNFLPKPNEEAAIYRTINGGKNWNKICSIDNYAFYNTAFNNGRYIFIKIIDNRSSLKNRLLKFDLKTHKISLLDFNFEKMGEIWGIDNKIFVNSRNRGTTYIYSIDSELLKTDSIPEDNIFKDKVALLGKTPYVITWDNKIYNLRNKQATSLKDLNPILSTKKDNSHLLIAGKKGENIVLQSYDVLNEKIENLQEFSGYGVIEGLQSSGKVFSGFIGNIKGAFTAYDLCFSLDEGKTWKIQKLKEENYIRPNFLLGNILYVYSGGKRIQKIVLK